MPSGISHNKVLDWKKNDSPWWRYRLGLLIHFLLMDIRSLLMVTKLYWLWSVTKPDHSHRSLNRSDQKRHNHKQLFRALKTQTQGSWGLKSNFSLPSHSSFKFFCRAYRKSIKILKHMVKSFFFPTKSVNYSWKMIPEITEDKVRRD